MTNFTGQFLTMSVYVAVADRHNKKFLAAPGAPRRMVSLMNYMTLVILCHVSRVSSCVSSPVSQNRCHTVPIEECESWLL